MPRCFVLGANGFIGKHVTHVLSQAGIDVVRGNATTDSSINARQVDFLDVASLCTAFDGVNTVIHLAWTTVPQSATDDPIHDIQTNVIGSLNVLKACLAKKVRRIIFTSTGGAIYGLPLYIPVPESHPQVPVSSYGISKLMVEKYITLFSHLYGLEYIILRPSNAFGEGQSTKKRQGVIAACLDAVRSRHTFNVWGDGSVIRDYVHVDDIARSVLAACNTKTANHIVNIGSSKGTSINQLLELITQVTGIAIDVNYIDHRLVDAPVNVLDCSQAARLLGWQGQISLEEGIRRQWRFLQEFG